MNFRYLFFSACFLNLSMLGMHTNFVLADADTRNYCLNELAINSECRPGHSQSRSGQIPWNGRIRRSQPRDVRIFNAALNAIHNNNQERSYRENADCLNELAINSTRRSD